MCVTYMRWFTDERKSSEARELEGEGEDESAEESGRQGALAQAELYVGC